MSNRQNNQLVTTETLWKKKNNNHKYFIKTGSLAQTEMYGNSKKIILYIIGIEICINKIYKIKYILT